MSGIHQILLAQAARPVIPSGGISTNQGAGSLPGWVTIGVGLQTTGGYNILADTVIGSNPPPFLASGFTWANLNGHPPASIEIRLTKIGGVLNLDTAGGSLTVGVYYPMTGQRAWWVDGAAGQEFLGTLDIRDVNTLQSYGSESFVLHCT